MKKTIRRSIGRVNSRKRRGRESQTDSENIIENKAQVTAEWINTEARKLFGEENGLEPEDLK